MVRIVRSFTKQQILSILVIAGTLVVFYFYSVLFLSTLRYENNKALFNAKYFNNNEIALVERINPVAALSDSWHSVYLDNPAETELKLRVDLMDNNVSAELSNLYIQYGKLIHARPSWPYYYSSLSQAEFARSQNGSHNINQAMKYGPHEKQVVLGIAELLFYNWNVISEEEKIKLMEYLLNQSESLNSLIVKISAKFARIYEYCDFIYEKKHVEYAACKQQYWKPLVQ